MTRISCWQAVRRAVSAPPRGGFQALTALTEETDPARASIPFDKDRSGFVLGEGAGVVVLEELQHALARGARIYAELVGYGATGDAFHITSPSEDGSGAAKAMELAIKEGRRPAVRGGLYQRPRNGYSSQ